MLPDGRVLQLKLETIEATHESAGIEGLPNGIEPIMVAEGRFRVDLPSGIRLLIDHQQRYVTVGDVSGSTLIFSESQLDSYGEELVVRLMPGEVKGFYSTVSQHRGAVEADGSIRLNLAQGEDLTFRFPGESGDGANGDDEQTGKTCQDLN